MSMAPLTAGPPLQREVARTVFQKGAPGRRAFQCPDAEVPAADPQELLPARFRRAQPPHTVDRKGHLLGF